MNARDEMLDVASRQNDAHRYTLPVRAELAQQLVSEVRYFLRSRIGSESYCDSLTGKLGGAATAVQSHLETLVKLLHPDNAEQLTLGRLHDAGAALTKSFDLLKEQLGAFRHQGSR